MVRRPVRCNSRASKCLSRSPRSSKAREAGGTGHDGQINRPAFKPKYQYIHCPLPTRFGVRQCSGIDWQQSWPAIQSFRFDKLNFGLLLVRLPVHLLSSTWRASIAKFGMVIWHVSPRLAPTKGAKLCTYFAWSFRSGQLRFEPYLDVPMPLFRLRILMQFRMGSHSLPVEQGRLARPMVLRQLRRCTLCNTHAKGDEQHYVFDCPHFAHNRRQLTSLFQDADEAMQSFMWHRNQKAVCHCLAAILTLADDSSMDVSS